MAPCAAKADESAMPPRIFSSTSASITRSRPEGERFRSIETA
jgi:hypothetical protein